MFLSKINLIQDLRTGFVAYIKVAFFEKQHKPSRLPWGRFCVTVHSETKLPLTLRLPERSDTRV